MPETAIALEYLRSIADEIRAKANFDVAVELYSTCQRN